MVLVRMAISLYGKAKMVPGYIKHPPVEWIGDDQVEGYVNSEGYLVLEIHRDKVQVDEAKRTLPGFEKDLAYNQNQVGKINKELQNGHLGRKGDLDKFESTIYAIQDDIRVKMAIIEGATVERIEFAVEDCN